MSRHGFSGLSVHTPAARSWPYAIPIFFSASFFSSLRPSLQLTVLPSKPRTCPSSIFSYKKSGISGTPSSCMRNSSIPVPSSSLSAWIKYRPSVQSPAISCPTTNVPLDPVKPEKYSLVLKYSSTYSELW